jgi:uncharacterized protein DUF6766
VLKRLVRDNGLTLVCALLFAVFAFGQSVTGHREYNADQRDHHEKVTSYGDYLGTGHFWEGLTENWESEFLQMASYVLLTVWLFQRGSAESRDPDKEKSGLRQARRDEPPRRDSPRPVRKGGLYLALYENSLFLAFLALFVLSFVLHGISGASAYNAEATAHGGHTLSTIGFMGTSEFWYQSFQNWQSEFLAVAAIVLLSVFLRQRGSTESKPVNQPNAKTGA